MQNKIITRAWNGQSIISNFFLNEDGEACWWDNNTGQLIEEPSWTLMRYTGMCDYDGKKIFEGDIVQFIPKDFQPDQPIYWAIEYEKGGFWADSSGLWDYASPIGDGPEQVCQELVVIGNIYEDKDKGLVG